MLRWRRWPERERHSSSIGQSLTPTLFLIHPSRSLLPSILIRPFCDKWFFFADYRLLALCSSFFSMRRDSLSLRLRHYHRLIIFKHLEESIYIVSGHHYMGLISVWWYYALLVLRSLISLCGTHGFKLRWFEHSLLFLYVFRLSPLDTRMVWDAFFFWYDLLIDLLLLRRLLVQVETHIVTQPYIEGLVLCYWLVIILRIKSSGRFFSIIEKRF